jgi:RecB family endonuclease NucS
LEANLGHLENGLTLLTEGGITGRQVAAGAAGRIDLLAVDGRGAMVVIELKAGEADWEDCGQIQA